MNRFAFAALICTLFASCTTRTEIVTQYVEPATTCGDGGSHDAPSDVSTDAPTDRSSDVVADHAPEATAEASAEAAVESGNEAAVDAGAEAALDAPADAVAESGQDAPVEATAEAGPEAGADAGTCLTVANYTMRENDFFVNNQTVTSAPMNTQPTTSLIVFVAYADAEFPNTLVNNVEIPTSPLVFDNFGNTYVMGTTVVYGTHSSSYGGPGSTGPGNNYQMTLESCFGCAGGAGHTLSVTRTPAASAGEVTFWVVEVPGATAFDAVSALQTYNEPMSTSVTTTLPGDLLIYTALDNSGPGNNPPYNDTFTAGGGMLIYGADTYIPQSMVGASEYGCAGAPGVYSPTMTAAMNDPVGGNASVLVAVH